jgi:hypothetical protein
VGYRAPLRRNKNETRALLKCQFERELAIYGLSQSGYLANQDLIKNLAKHGYHPVKRTPGLWKHETRKTTFTLVVDDFGVQYFSKEDADHLIDAIKESYPVKVDWTGSKYVGIDLKWNYDKEEVVLSMEGYVKKAMKEYQHTPPNKPFDVHLPNTTSPNSDRKYSMNERTNHNH